MNNVSVKAHREEKERLKSSLGKSFLTNFIKSEEVGLSYYNYELTDIKALPIEEYPIPISIGKNRIGGNNVQTRFIDFVYILKPGDAAIFRQECCTIGVEIKSSVSDLFRDPLQINRYLGKTDYMFLCVPNDMLNVAIEYVQSEERLGLFNLETGEIVVFPIRQEMDPTWKEKLLLRALFAEPALPMMQFKPVSNVLTPSDAV